MFYVRFQYQPLSEKVLQGYIYSFEQGKTKQNIFHYIIMTCLLILFTLYNYYNIHVILFFFLMYFIMFI